MMIIEAGFIFPLEETGKKKAEMDRELSAGEGPAS